MSVLVVVRLSLTLHYPFAAACASYRHQISRMLSVIWRINPATYSSSVFHVAGGSCLERSVLLHCHERWVARGSAQVIDIAVVVVGLYHEYLGRVLCYK